ncbi:non sense mediated decay [Hyphodiscus hymeniophilus]|uniref:Non sense mediated decay n=1 Tax=Hyphodiscus hymeniophilus TaxID=353542 RepID=A0A9P7AV56_9HELO|nr:non sense mediated decay [Hyphodiscus hymeniophilus]
MAQGAIKTRPAAGTAKSARRQNAPGAKKGARTIAPRKAALVKNGKITKKYSAGLTAMTERTLGAKAGHLELLKGGKKNKDAKDGKDAKGKPVEVRKGGSKKFG